MLQVVSKIIKHGRETTFGTGSLLGLDFDGTMEVSNSFPLPAFPEEEDRSAKAVAQGKNQYICLQIWLTMMTPANYQRKVIGHLREVQGDENAVGFYQTTTVPLRQSLVDLQAADNARLRQGGILVIHGQ